ncbi:MAG: ribosome-associated translation inhibitor RaiA [Dehalococcoidia bacterium]|nr:MAG: ribosome-associated translation inhibitor RaiA [Dehalococcoidia bacterium]
MELNITSKNVELTPEIQRYIQRKLGHFNHHLINIMETKIDIVEEKTKSQQHRFLLRVTATGSNTRLHGEERGRTVLTAIDNVARNMQRQIEHHKGKLHNKKGRGNSAIKSGVNRGSQLSQDRKYIIKQLDIKPMSVAEATDQLELLNYNFFFFNNTETEKLTLLYRRMDGNYGIIEP